MTHHFQIYLHAMHRLSVCSICWDNTTFMHHLHANIRTDPPNLQSNLWIGSVLKGLTTNKHRFNHIRGTSCVLEVAKRPRCHKVCSINTIKWWNDRISSPPKCSAWNVSLPEHCWHTHAQNNYRISQTYIQMELEQIVIEQIWDVMKRCNYVVMMIQHVHIVNVVDFAQYVFFEEPSDLGFVILAKLLGINCVMWFFAR